MDELDKWFQETSRSTVGQILLFILIYLSRLALDQWTRKRQAKHQTRKKAKHSG